MSDKWREIAWRMEALDQDVKVVKPRALEYNADTSIKGDAPAVEARAGAGN